MGVAKRAAVAADRRACGSDDDDDITDDHDESQLMLGCWVLVLVLVLVLVRSSQFSSQFEVQFEVRSSKFEVRSYSVNSPGRPQLVRGRDAVEDVQQLGRNREGERPSCSCRPPGWS